MNAGAAQGWFVAGALTLVLAGGLHVVYTLVDSLRPKFLAPVDGRVKGAMESTGIRLRRGAPGGDKSRPTVWSAWLGFNFSHGLGIVTFGALCLLIALHDFDLVERIDGLRPLTIAFPAVLLAVALRFWFYVPVLIAGTATACFAISAVLSA